MDEYKVTLSPIIIELEKLHNFFDQIIPEKKQSESPYFRLRTCTAEWVTNLIQYPSKKPNEITLTGAIDNDNIIITVEDDSTFFDSFHEKKSLLSQPPEILQESGYGIYFIHYFFPDLKYYKKNNKNIFKLAIKDKNIDNITIYIIDDTLSTAKILESYLKNIYITKIFNNDDNLLKAIQKKLPELIISNIQRETGTALELRSRLSKDKKFSLIPFIFLTANDDQEIIEKAISLGVDDFLKKPIKKNVLINCVKRIINRKKIIHDYLGDIYEKRLSNTLFPKIPENFANLHFKISTNPASAGGGDFIIKLKSDNNLRFIICDVMGHGARAKFYAHVFAGFIIGLAKSIDLNYSLDKFMQKFSELISDEPLLEEVIVTALGIEISQNSLVNIVNAGQPFPYLVNKDSIFQLKFSGNMPSLNTCSNYKQHSVEIKKGEKFIFITDAVYEIGENYDDFKRHQKSIENIIISEEKNDKLCEKIIKYYNEKSTICNRDDLTILIIENPK